MLHTWTKKKHSDILDLNILLKHIVHLTVKAVTAWLIIQVPAQSFHIATFQNSGGMSCNGWTGSQPTGGPIPPCSPPPPCPPPPSFPTAPQPQLKPLHHRTPATVSAINTPAPLHQSTPASAAAGSQHQRSTSRTPVPSPFLEPQQPQRAGSNSNQQWGAPPQQLTAAQVVESPGNFIVI